MTGNTIPIIMLVVYALLTVVVANTVLRKKLGAEHFLVAGRALPLSLVVAVLLGDMVGGASTVGVTQRGYSYGIMGALYSISLGLAFFAVAGTMSARFRRLHAITIPEVIGRLFDAKTRLTAAIVIAISYFFIGITQIMAGGALLSPLLGIPVWQGKFVSSAIFAIIIAVGGLKSIAVVNIIQVFMIMAGMLASLWFSLSLVGGSVTGGLERLATELPPSFWGLGGQHPMTISGEILGTVFTFFAAQAAITGVFAARDEQAASRGTWISGILMLPVGIAFALIGMCARVHFGDTIPSGLSAAPAMMLALHPVVAGTALCGLFAAIVSTGPLNFLAPIQIYIRDIHCVYLRPDASDRSLIVINRIAAVVLLALGWVVAVSFEEILNITYWAFAFRAGIAVILLAVVYLGARVVSEDGAFWGLITGVVVFAAWTLAGSPYEIHVAIPSIFSVFFATLIFSRISARKRPLKPEVEAAMYKKVI